MRESKWKWLLLLSAALVCLDGCVTSRPTTLVRYDAEQDRFDILNVVEDIRFEYEVEAAGLGELWTKRDSWIPIVGDSGNFGDWSLLRIDDHHVSPMQLGQSEVKPGESVVNVGLIEIHPGEFFTNEDSGLSLYQSIRVPGEFFDDCLKALTEPANRSLDEFSKRELETDRSRMSWPSARQQLTNTFQKNRESESNPSSRDRPYSRSAFRKESLDRMLAEEITFKRTGSTLTATIPMGLTDQLEVIETFDHYRSLQKDHLANSRSLFANLVRNTSLSKTPDGIEVRVDLAGKSEPIPTSKPTAESIFGRNSQDRKYLARPASIQLLEKYGVPIRTDLTVQEIISDWQRDTGP